MIEPGSLMRRRVISSIGLFLLVSLNGLHAQVALDSENERWNEHSVLLGTQTREHLSYRTFSDNRWREKGDNTERDGREVSITTGVSGFGSYNSAYPEGQNDGALWQGVGFNARLSGGIRVESLFFELTFWPDFGVAQNADFPVLAAASGIQEFGSYRRGLDTYQRPGDAPFGYYSMGDSELRLKLANFTAGFGWQSIWLGPAKQNPIMHSNNAAPYPKFDLGLRKTQTFLGSAEIRAWWGKLEESSWFDSDAANDSTLITGLAASFAPAFAPGLVLGLHRTLLSKWSDTDWNAIFTLVWPLMDDNAGKDERDQRASITASWLMPEANLECYFEWARNDYSPSLDAIIRYPFHTQAYTIGFRKALFIREGLSAELRAELSNLESSRDYEFLGATTFYEHHRVIHGYTNSGQIIGAGIGTGGNSQYLEFALLGGHRRLSFYVQRRNRDNDHVWFLHFGQSAGEKRLDELKFSAMLAAGVELSAKLGTNQYLRLHAAFDDNHNILYESNPDGSSARTPSLRFDASFEFLL